MRDVRIPVEGITKQYGGWREEREVAQIRICGALLQFSREELANMAV